MAMNKRLKKKWVKALRSGEFKQIPGRLGKKSTGNCCLGVLCHVALGRSRYSTHGYIPDKLADKLGISLKVQDWLIGLNDSSGLSFEKIAKKIENSTRI